MSFHKTKVDLLWSDSGDFCLDGNRLDLADTTKYSYRAFIQEVLTVLSASPGDWRLHPNMGANLDRFAGKRNTEEVGNAIKAQVTNSLTSAGLMRSSELKVDVFPTSEKTIGIVISIMPAGDTRQIQLIFNYSLQDNKIIPRKI